MQDNNYKNQLLIVDQNLVGIKDRGTINNNAVVSGTAITFHPMVRDNWGTSDPLRGVLGSYYTRYRSSKGEALYDYSNALRAITNGYVPQDFDHGPGGIGPLRNQLQGDAGFGTNIIFPVSFFPSTDDKIQLVGDPFVWEDYSTVAVGLDNGSQWFLNNFDEYVFGSLKPANELLTIEDIVNENTALYQGLLNDQNIENKAFSDHTSMHFLLSSDRSLRERSGVLTGVEPVYNYYVNSNPDYEDVIADPRVEEYLIPNAYYLQLELQNTDSFPLAPYHVLAVQFGQQPIVVANTPEGPRPWFNISSYTYATENNIGSYYSLYSDGMSTRISTLDQNAKNTLQTVNGDIAILHSDIGVLSPDSIEPMSIPFFNKITIGQDTEGPLGSTSFLGDILSNPDTSNFVDMLQAFAILSYDGTTPPAAQFSTRYKILNNVNNLNDYAFESDDIAFPILFDLGDMLSSGMALSGLYQEIMLFYQNKSPGGISSITSNVKFLRDYFGRSLDDLMGDVSFDAVQASNIYDIALAQSDLNSEVFKRSLKQIFQNKTCHSETLLYVIEKYRVEDNQLVQKIFISPNINGDGPDLTYYDSQVKYNTKYRYDFKKVVLVFGNRYTYPDRNGFSAGLSQASVDIVDIQNTPSIKAILVPYTTDGIEVAIIDRPPVSPSISFYPVKGNDTNVKVLLNASTGDYMDRPVQILDADAQFYEEEYFGQTGVNKSFEDIRSENRKIQFKSDDPVNKYQLFRIGNMPTSYRDFNNNFVEVDPEIGVVGYYQDNILPNRKYYYCARSLDVHNNISNPTYIFEIEMVNNEGQVFLRQDIFTFEAAKPEVVKNGRRFIYIEPSFNQVALENPPDAPANVNVAPENNILGIADQQESCWNETFKIRVTSKKTGKKLDLNLTFKNSGVTNPS